jgi:glycosyltransferase involved in cell wall biosynthesis
MTQKLNISVVIPAFNEAESLPELCSWITRVMQEHNYSYEVIIIDDGSTDNSWEVLKGIYNENSAIKGVCFKRNYGKSGALNRGFDLAQGDVVFTMDADLQDSPDEIPDLYKMVKEEGYDLVSGWKKKRYDPLSKTIPTKLFNGATRYISKVKLNDFNCGLKAYHHKVIKTIDVYGEMHRYIPVIAKWAGFNKIGEKEVQHRERKYGVTKFGLERFIFGFLDLMSITFVSKFKNRPMHFFGSMGSFTFFIGFAITVYLIIKKMLWVYGGGIGRDIVDQPLFYLALSAVIIGVQLFLAGFIAEIVSLNNPKRKSYIIDDKIGLD